MTSTANLSELKARQSEVWGSAPFERVAETIADVHATVIERLAPQPGDRLLDVACGTGQLTLLAARRGAQATGVDFAPALLETARRRASEAGVDVDYRVGDAEDLRDLADGDFDFAASTFGIMFAPNQAAAAAELSRVVRGGGRIALATWPPDGAVAEMFRALAAFQPPPPPEAGVPLAWGDPEHVETLLGGAFELEFERLVTRSSAPSEEALWELFSTSFGPLRTMLATADDEQRQRIRAVWRELAEPDIAPDGSIASERDYLLVLGRRR
jgi:SAM-dependent methyltransferase